MSANHYRISTKPEIMDYMFIIHAVRSLPGGDRGSNAQILEALKNSLVLGAFENDGGPAHQVGVVRVVTDHALFSSITDVYVHPQHRNRGVGFMLMQEAVVHDSVRRTFCILQCEPPLGKFYQPFGFMPVSIGSTIYFRPPTT